MLDVLIILIFDYFLCKNCTPSEKSYPLFSSNPPLKTEILSSPSPPFWKFGQSHAMVLGSHKKRNKYPDFIKLSCSPSLSDL